MDEITRLIEWAAGQPGYVLVFTGVIVSLIVLRQWLNNQNRFIVLLGEFATAANKANEAADKLRERNQEITNRYHETRVADQRLQDAYLEQLRELRQQHAKQLQELGQEFVKSLTAVVAEVKNIDQRVNAHPEQVRELMAEDREDLLQKLDDQTERHLKPITGAIEDIRRLVMDVKDEIAAQGIHNLAVSVKLDVLQRTVDSFRPPEPLSTPGLKKPDVVERGQHIGILTQDAVRDQMSRSPDEDET